MKPVRENVDRPGVCRFNATNARSLLTRVSALILTYSKRKRHNIIDNLRKFYAKVKVLFNDLGKSEYVDHRQNTRATMRSIKRLFQPFALSPHYHSNSEERGKKHRYSIKTLKLSFVLDLTSKIFIDKSSLPT